MVKKRGGELMKRLTALILTLALALAACGPDAPVTQPTTQPTEPTTQPTQSTAPAVPMDLTGNYVLDVDRNEAVIDDIGPVSDPVEGNARLYYQIFVGSFSDSNGDGIGDLQGIIQRFDYLNDGDPDFGLSLGVEGIWLTPIFDSPSYHKYDVADYYTIDPDFGTMEDLYELIQLCHSRGVQIILDLPINHTATSCQWFRDFTSARRGGDTENPYYDFYSCTDTPGGGKTYNPITGTDFYYECNFSGSMPELNFDNDQVRQEVVNIAKYYLDLGVDGFRFDAAKYIYYGETEPSAAFWDWYMAELRAMKPDIYTVAEVWDGDAAVYPYYTSTNCFNFTMSQVSGQIAVAAKGGNVDVLTRYVENYIGQIQSRRDDAMMVTFITNHDMDRAAGFLPNSTGQAKVAANLSILMPGSTFVYYGEEIGMKGSRGGANTDANRRLAMLWGDGDTVTDPEGTDYASEQTNGTVADQLPDGDSLYSHYKRLIAIRRANPEIAYGEYRALELADTKAGGFLSTYEGRTVAVFHNTTTETVQIDLASLDLGVELETLAAYAGVGSATLEGSILTLEGQTSAVLR